MKYAIAAVVALALIGAAFYGGTVYGKAGASTGPGGLVSMADGSSPPNGMGGPMANLTEEEQAQLESMTDEERREFLQQKMEDSGVEMPAGGGMRGPGGGVIEGTVLEVADDSVTIELANGGSQTVYTDDDTIVAKTEGAGELTKDADVLVVATPEADGVTIATAIVVK